MRDLGQASVCCSELWAGEACTIRGHGFRTFERFGCAILLHRMIHARYMFGARSIRTHDCHTRDPEHALARVACVHLFVYARAQKLV